MILTIKKIKEAVNQLAKHDVKIDYMWVSPKDPYIPPHSAVLTTSDIPNEKVDEVIGKIKSALNYIDPDIRRIDGMGHSDAPACSPVMSDSSKPRSLG